MAENLTDFIDDDSPLDTGVPPEIRRVLDRLRGKIRRYVFLEGVALVLIVLIGLFWVSLGLDWGYFLIRRLELPVWFRQVFTIGSVAVVLFCLVSLVILRAARAMRTKALALVLERRFPELNDRLITAVEVARSISGHETPLTRQMLRQTVTEVTEETDSLNLGQVFNNRPLARALVIAGVLVISVVGLFVANSQAMERWSRAFLSWDETYWDRSTGLSLHVIAQPNDVLRDFDEELTYKHPRGQDLDLRAHVDPEKLSPEVVELYYKKAGGRGEALVPMSAAGQDKFKYALPNLRDDVELWVYGGDYTNRRPYQVLVVDAPEVERLAFACDYPEYTGMNQTASRNFRVRGSDPSLPVGTKFVMQITGNKPLQSFVLETGLFLLDCDRESGQLVIKGNPLDKTQPDRTIELSAEEVKSLWATEPAKLEIPASATAEEREKLEADHQERTSLAAREIHISCLLTRPEDAAARVQKLAGLKDVILPVSSSAEDTIRIYLEDTDQITMRDPYRFSVQGIDDKAPKVETVLRGVRNKITPQASVPVAGTIEDDYGIAKARFELFVPEEKEGQVIKWEPSDLLFQPRDNPARFRLGPPDDDLDLKQQVERFDVKALQLEPGQKLMLSVLAEDTDSLWGPNSQRSEVHNFELVTKSELLMIIYGDELRLMQQYADLIKKVERVRDELDGSRDDINAALALRQQAQSTEEDLSRLGKLDNAVLSVAETGLHDLRTSAIESTGVEQTFRDILAEMENNEIDDKSATERIRTELLSRFVQVNGIKNARLEKDNQIGLFDETDLAVGSFKSRHEATIAARGGDALAELDDSLRNIDALLTKMREILKEIEELVKFHDAQKKLQAIYDAQLKLKDDTRKKQLESLPIFDP